MFDKSRRWVYAVVNKGMLVRSDFDVMETVIQPWDNNTSILQDDYLVETTSNNGDNGDLLMISISIINGNLKVFKLRDSSFVEVDDMNGDAVFLGDEHSRGSMVVAARDYRGIKANYIYLYRSGRIRKINVKDEKPVKLSYVDADELALLSNVFVDTSAMLNS
ncbi:hypothetical protein LINPERHAP1_LOCUS7020 [Linum perenne]